MERSVATMTLPVDHTQAQAAAGGHQGADHLVIVVLNREITSALQCGGVYYYFITLAAQCRALKSDHHFPLFVEDYNIYMKFKT